MIVVRNYQANRKRILATLQNRVQAKSLLILIRDLKKLWVSCNLLGILIKMVEFQLLVFNFQGNPKVFSLLILIEILFYFLEPITIEASSTRSPGPRTTINTTILIPILLIARTSTTNTKDNAYQQDYFYKFKSYYVHKK